MTNQPSFPVFGANPIANLLLKYNYQAKIGDILVGPFIGREKTQTSINLGFKKVTFLPWKEELINFKKVVNSQLFVPLKSEFILLALEEKQKGAIVSCCQLQYIKLWEKIQQVEFKNLILTTFVCKRGWSGKFVNLDGLNLFIPNSHLTKYYRRKNLTSTSLKIKILEIKNKNHTLVGSSKLVFFKKQSPSLQVGLQHSACVLSIKSFGLFLNVYGLKCLLHISEISNQKINSLEEKFKKGDLINVKIIYINNKEAKIALSAKNEKN